MRFPCDISERICYTWKIKMRFSPFPHTGAVYVSVAGAGGAAVLRFSAASLRLEARYTVPQCDEEDNGGNDCSTAACPGNLTDPRFTDADERQALSAWSGILRLDSMSGQLLVCGGRCGHCSVLNTSSQDPDGLRALDRTSTASYIASRVAGARPVAVFTAANTTTADRGGSNVTLTASRLFIAGATALDAEAVSVREQSSGAAGFDVVGRRSFASSAYAQSYRFTDALDAGDGFMYFVALRRYERYAPPTEMRLVRVCRDDSGRLDSYAELRLSCVLQTALTASLDVPVTAHVAPVGAWLARRYRLEPGKPAIYLVAETREPDSDDDDERWTSGICIYTMREVTLIPRLHEEAGSKSARLALLERS